MPTSIHCVLGAALVAAMIMNTGDAAAGGPHENIPGPHVDRDVPDYDFQWATVGDVGNANWRGPYSNDGYGRVNYKYRISRHEVTTGQWMEFVNAIAPLTDDPADFARPGSWGALPIGAGRYALNPNLEQAAMTPVIGITWREAAMFCNWLDNDKVASLDAIAAGAYDTSTFGGSSQQGFTDQSMRSPGARFWIPSQSEWMKAAHWDPDRYAEDEGGWWVYPHSSDTMPIPGLPGEGESATGLDGEFPTLFTIPLGAYHDVQSPWGLWDTSGGGLEWTERWAPQSVTSERGWESSYNSAGNGGVTDSVGSPAGSARPTLASFATVRIASLVPAPGLAALGLVAVLTTVRRRR